MKKTIRILAAGGMGVYGLSFLLLTIAVVFQTALVPALLEIKQEVFIVPVSQVVYGLGMLALAIAAFFLSGSEKRGAWINILLIAAAVLLIPLSSELGKLQNLVVGKFAGVQMVLSLNAVNTLTSYATCLNPVAYALFMVSGGMRITYQHMNKKIQKAL